MILCFVRVWNVDDDDFLSSEKVHCDRLRENIMEDFKDCVTDELLNIT